MERFFKQHPNKAHDVGTVMSATGLSGDQVRGAISYLRAKANAGKAIEISTVTPGESWGYYWPHRKRPGDTGAETARRKGASPEAQAKVDKLNEVVGLGTAQFNRMIDALGEAEAAEGRAVLAKEIRLRLVGTTPDGYAIGVHDGTGNTFKVVPV